MSCLVALRSSTSTSLGLVSLVLSGILKVLHPQILTDLHDLPILSYLEPIGGYLFKEALEQEVSNLAETAAEKREIRSAGR